MLCLLCTTRSESKATRHGSNSITTVEPPKAK
jgi:hypothetical protein